MTFRSVFPFRPTTIARAFILSSLLIAITTALTIEVRRIIDERQYTKELPDIPHKVLITTFVSMIIGFTSYLIIRALFGLGGGMLAPKKRYPYFF